MADYLPRYHDAVSIPLIASEDVIGGNLVAVSGSGTVKHATSTESTVVGVAAFDAKNGETVTVYRRGVQRLTAFGEIAAGSYVSVGEAGYVVKNDRNIIGFTLTSASKKGDVIDVVLI